MKKFPKVLFVSVFVFALVIGICEASGFDLTSIPIDELELSDLLALRKEIDLELDNRHYEDNEILQGLYIAGKDISVGSFVFYYPKFYGDNYSRIFVYESMSTYSSRDSMYSPFIKDEMGVNVILEEGYILEVAIDRCACKLQDSKKTWAP